MTQVNNPATPGHVFEVTYDGTSATWTSLDAGTGPMGDLPVTALARDRQTGDLYAATDFSVLRLAAGSDEWAAFTNGLPKVETAFLTISESTRTMYAATHGRGIWQLGLPEVSDGGDHGGGDRSGG